MFTLESFSPRTVSSAMDGFSSRSSARRIGIDAAMMVMALSATPHITSCTLAPVTHIESAEPGSYDGTVTLTRICIPQGIDLGDFYQGSRTGTEAQGGVSKSGCIIGLY